MSKKKITFGDVEIKKSTFHKSKYQIDIVKVAINKIVISNKISYVKRVLNTLLDTKMTIKLNRCVQFFQKWVDINKC